MSSSVHLSNSPVEVLPLRGRKMLNDFIRLSWTMNEGDPCWVPPLIVDVKEFLDPKRHPFYKHGTAEKFVAYQDGKPVGRIIASDDPVLNNRKGTNLGAWGMFECVADPLVASALFDAAKKWSLDNHGREALIGPMDYSTNYPVGLLTEGFEYPQVYGMNHNPPYYHDLMIACGLERVHEMYAWFFDDSSKMLEKWQKRADWFLKRTKITFRSFDKKHFEKDVRLCRSVYNASLRDNWNYAELTDAEIHFFAKQLVRFADPGHIFLAFDEEKPVGFSITLPDLNQAIKPMNGRLFPFGIFKFLARRRHIRNSRMMVLCVDPEYRGRGISELLVLKTLDYGVHVRGYTTAELGWTYKDNTNVNHIIERVGGRPYKTYSLYELKTH